MGSNRVNYPNLLPNAHISSQVNYGSVNGNFVTNIEPSIMDGISVDGKLSITRRFFILLTVFDLLFTFLVWIICTVISTSSTIEQALDNEVLKYNITSSLFDVVILGLARLILIALFYVAIRISHWWVVALTTTGTTVFIIAKVFLYQWAHSNTTASVVLILSSFVLSWGEAWFLDFRVLPVESKANSILAKYDEEQAPGLSHPALSRSQSDDGSAFYSPPGSDGEDNGKEHDGSTVSEVEWLSPKNSRELPSDKEYRQLAEEALQSAITIIESNGWKIERSDGEDTIYSKVIPSYGKVFKFEGILYVSPKKIIDLIYFKGEDMHKWNPTVKKIRIIKKIDDNIDIAHVIATEGAAGLVSSRDFVNIRIWKKEDLKFVHGSVATTHPSAPAVGKYVRGEQGPCVCIISPIPEEDNKCNFQWLLNTNLKGWIPQYLIDQTLSTVMFEYVQSLRKYASSNHP